MPRSVAHWVETARAVERWLLPGECLLCRARTGADDDLVCRVCRSRWGRVPDPICPRCGQPLDPDVECRLCTEWPSELTSARSAVWLDPAARRTVHYLKYEGWRRIAESMAAAMLALVTPDDVLIPIPLGAARERTRGYNQSAELGARLSRMSRARFDGSLLIRIKETKTQTALTPEGRRANVSGAFRARRRLPPRVVLIDDVFTTGATLASAAVALVAGGAREVRAITFARAERPLDRLLKSL